MANTRALFVALLAPAMALVVFAACENDDNTPAAGFDGGGACTLQPCVGGDAQADRFVPTPLDSGDITDAGAADADPWADADPNCASYADTTNVGGVTVRIRNLKTSPLYVGNPTPNCQFNIGFDLRDQADASQTVALQNDNRCGSEQTNAVCPASSCYPQVVTKIGPDGGYYDVGWPATVFKPRYMAKSCYADAACATEPCMQEQVAPSGTIHVTAYPNFYCDGGACFDCTNGGLVSCLVVGSVGGTTGTPVTGSVAYDGGGGIYQIDIGP